MNLWAGVSLIYKELDYCNCVDQSQNIMKALMRTRSDSIPANEDQMYHLGYHK